MVIYKIKHIVPGRCLVEFTFDGVKINYTDEGSGKCVVLLHGWGADLHSFDFVIPSLSEYRTVRIDLPGHGESSEPERVYGVDDFCGCVRALLDGIGVSSPTLVGHSNGGRIIIKLLADGYDAEKAVLIDSAGIIPKRTLSYKFKVWRYKTAKKLIKLFYGKRADEKLEMLKKSHGSADYKNASGVMRDTMVKLVNTDLKPCLEKINVPTLLIWGTEDSATPISDGRLMESLIKDSGLVELQGGSHWAFVEQPRKFISVLLSFLNS